MKVTLLNGGRKICLEEDIIVQVLGKESVTVPQGFICDYASVPRIFWNILPPMGIRYSKPAILHDYMYRYHQVQFTQLDTLGCIRTMVVTREQADRTFKLSLKWYKVRIYRVFFMYWAVRLFGKKRWDKGYE